MSSNLHSQAWHMNGNLVIGVVIVLVIAGTLYLINTQSVPALPPDARLPQDQPVAHLSKRMTSSPPAHIGTRFQSEAPASLHTSESAQRPQEEMAASTESLPRSVHVTPSPPNSVNRTVRSSTRETPQLSTQEVALVQAVAASAPSLSQEEASVEEDNGEFSISGRVLTEAGEPVDGIEVVATLSRLVEHDASGMARARERHTHTGTTGGYEFASLFDGEYQLYTVPSGPYSSTSKRVRAGLDEVTLIVAEARSRRVQGLVKQTPLNTPLVGVTVATAGHTSTTDEAGQYELTVPLPGNGQGPSLLRFSHPGYHAQQVPVPGPNRQPGEQLTLKDVALEPVEGLSAVSGIVENRQGGTPVAGVRVFLAPSGKLGQQDTLTSQEGTFHFPSVAWGRYTLVVAPKTGYQDFTQPDLQVGAEGVEDLTIPLTPLSTGQLTGQLVDAIGEPVRGLTLWLNSLTVRTYPTQPITSDASGYFLVDDVPAGKLQFTTRSDPHLSITGLTIQPGTTPLVHLPVDSGLQTLTGHVVTTAGLPLPGAEITLSWSQSTHGLTSRAIRHSTADSGGSFRFTQLGPGKHTLNVSAPGYTRTLVDHEVGPDQPTVHVTLMTRTS